MAQATTGYALEDEDAEPDETAGPETWADPSPGAETGAQEERVVFRWPEPATEGPEAYIQGGNAVLDALDRAPSNKTLDKAKSTARAALAGAATGAALGSVFPGVGTAIGGVVGGGLGAISANAKEIGSFFGGIFGRKKRKRHGSKAAPQPAPKTLYTWQAKVMQGAAKALHAPPESPNFNPAKALDALFLLTGKLDYRKEAAANRLPSQRWATLLASGKLLRRGAKLDKVSGPAMRKLVAGLSPAEASMVSLGLTLGLGKETHDALRRLREKQEGPAALVSRASNEVGTRKAVAPTAADLPRPRVVGNAPLHPKVLAHLLRHAPGLMRLPQPVISALGGYQGGPKDTRGVDARSREFVMLPGQTFADVAEQLTGDRNRAYQVEAANPEWEPASHRVAIPPSFLGYAFSGQSAETGDVDVKPEADKDPTKTASEPAPSAPPKTERPKRDGEREALTARTLTVRQDEWPEKIARLTGNRDGGIEWWRALKRANPHKTTVDGGGNWARLYAGEIINYPDSWKPNARAIPVAPLRDPASGGVATDAAPVVLAPGSLYRAQGILAIWVQRYPSAADPRDFGRAPQDLTGLETARFTSALRSFQTWSNRARGSSLAVDGRLSPETEQALNEWLADDAARAGGEVPELRDRDGAPLPLPLPTTLPQPMPAPRSGEPPKAADDDKKSSSGMLIPLAAAAAAFLMR